MEKSVPGHRYEQDPNVRSYLTEEGGVLLQVDTGKYYSLNRLGAMAWAQMESGPCPVGEMVDQASKVFAVSRERLESDLKAFLAKLDDLCLIRKSDA